MIHALMEIYSTLQTICIFVYIYICICINAMYCLLEIVENHSYWQKLFGHALRFQASPETISRSVLWKETFSNILYYTKHVSKHFNLLIRFQKNQKFVLLIFH